MALRGERRRRRFLGAPVWKSGRVSESFPLAGDCWLRPKQNADRGIKRFVLRMHFYGLPMRYFVLRAGLHGLRTSLFCLGSCILCHRLLTRSYRTHEFCLRTKNAVLRIRFCGVRAHRFVLRTCYSTVKGDLLAVSPIILPAFLASRLSALVRRCVEGVRGRGFRNQG